MQNILIYGGGESRREDFNSAPQCDLIVAANHHSISDGVQPDYMCCLDAFENVPIMAETYAAANSKPILISGIKHPSDITINHHEKSIFDSGQLAVWWSLNEHPGSNLYMCGFDIRNWMPSWVRKWKYFLFSIAKDLDRLNPISGRLPELIAWVKQISQVAGFTVECTPNCDDKTYKSIIKFAEAME